MVIFIRQLLGSHAQDLLTNAAWAFRRTWAASPRLTAGLVAATLLRSLTPAGLALMARGLINALIEVLGNDGSDINLLWPWLGLGLILTLLQTISNFVAHFCSRRLFDELNLHITTDILRHAAKLDVAFFEDPESQDMLERARQNTAVHFFQFISSTLGAITSAVQMVSLLAILVVIEPLVVGVLALFGPPYLLFQWRLSRMRYTKEHNRATKRRWTSYFVSQLTNQQTVPEVKMLNLAPLLINKFQTIMIEFRDQDRRLYRLGLTGNSIFATLSTVAFYLTFARVAWRAVGGALTVGDVAVYGGATSGLRSTLENLILSTSVALEQTLYISNLATFLAVEAQSGHPDGVTPIAARGRVEFTNVSFTYPGASQPALLNVSFSIRPGETVALVGENGAGKTTLVKLIAHLYEANHGVITFDGVDVRELSQEYLRNQISFVLQNFGRYEATVAENIAYGDWPRLLDNPEQIEQVASRANAHSLIKAMPNGYQTKLGRAFGEHDLSGGQWQIIAVARAFARDAALLILDEPTANLDARAEFELFSRFNELARGCTTILISHRFSTVGIADRIFVMANGQIVECGTHQELLAAAGHYYTLYNFHQRQMAASPKGAPAEPT